MNLSKNGNINDSLYNAHPDNLGKPENVNYGRGVIVGNVAMLMGCMGMTFETAVKTIAENSHQKISRQCLPESWINTFEINGLLMD